MKFKNIALTLSAILAALVMTGCDHSGTPSEIIDTNPVEETDTTAPVVTLIGEATVTITVGDTYTDAGATATDETDGTLTPVMSGTVNTSVAGTYTITWSATDAAGNTGTATRTVVVEDPAATCQNYNPITGLCEDTTPTTCQNYNPITGLCEDTI